MDELKRLHYEEHDRVVADPDLALRPLLDDAQYMLARMQQRIGEYDDYQERVRSALQRLDDEPATETEPADQAIEYLSKLSASADGYGATDVGEIGGAAEAIRSVASSLEHVLRARMELALELNRLFVDIKRDRAWNVDGADTGSYKQSIEAKYQSWLPSEPHRTALMDYLAMSKAEIIESEQPGGDPMIQFDNGGAIAMSQVRYDTEVQNFHPANHRPAPGGRQYRRATPASRHTPGN